MSCDLRKRCFKLSITKPSTFETFITEVRKLDVPYSWLFEHLYAETNESASLLLNYLMGFEGELVIGGEAVWIDRLGSAHCWFYREV